MKEFQIAWVKHYGWPEIIVHDQGPEFMGNEFQNRAGAAGVLTMPIDSQSPWQNGRQKERDSHSNINCGIWMKSVTPKVRQSLKLQWPSVVTRGTDTAIGQVFSAHQRVFGSSLRLLGSLLSDDPIDHQLLTADPYTNLHRANEMRTAAQRALFKQNSACAVQAAGLARHISQPREKHQCNNNLTGRKGWTGPGVVVAVSPTKTSFWISMR